MTSDKASMKLNRAERTSATYTKEVTTYKVIKVIPTPNHANVQNCETRQNRPPLNINTVHLPAALTAS